MQEEFTPAQERILERFVTNTKENVFALRNLPEVLKGALFSRYSRSTLGLRELLLKEFILNEETAFQAITGRMVETEESDGQEQMLAIQRAQNFYDRILDGYGDDSIGELGGAHLAVENVSMLAAKVLEDSRIGGSPLEKSTRYVYFDQKINGDYLFYREPVLMTSAYRDRYLDTCNNLFDTYSKLIPPLTEIMEERFPRTADLSSAAYAASVRAKVLDCLRGLLPASTLTNMGMFANGRFYENLLQKLCSHSLAETQEIGRCAHAELSKVMPSFVRRAESSHRHYKSYVEFSEGMRSSLAALSSHYGAKIPAADASMDPLVKLIAWDKECPIKVAAALLFAGSSANLRDLQELCRTLPLNEVETILEAAVAGRENRRHKSPRALEHAEFTFEIVADFGAFRDLHRHRMLTQERQLLTCNLGYYVPSELCDTSLEESYREALDRAREAYEEMAREFPEEAQYVVPMAYNIRWYFHANLRALQWLCELRSVAAGHSQYRYVAQEMAKQVMKVVPQFARFFKFVDFDGYELGRLGQEVRIAQKRALTRTTGGVDVQG